MATDDYNKGLITGLAMQPLFVADGRSSEGDCMCAVAVLPAVLSDEAYCRDIKEI